MNIVLWFVLNLWILTMQFIFYERGKSMQEAVPKGKGSMIAVLGSKINELNDFIKAVKTEGVCEIANDNAEGQTIISGDIESVKLPKYFERK